MNISQYVTILWIYLIQYVNILWIYLNMSTYYECILICQYTMNILLWIYMYLNMSISNDDISVCHLATQTMRISQYVNILWVWWCSLCHCNMTIFQYISLIYSVWIFRLDKLWVIGNGWYVFFIFFPYNSF
jgi:hypothetical protein